MSVSFVVLLALAASASLAASPTAATSSESAPSLASKTDAALSISSPPVDSAPAATSAPPLPLDSSMVHRTRNAILALNSGRLLTLVSLWTIPGIYDAGILTMMGSKKRLKNEYASRFHEDPPEFGQTGDNAYWQGWAMKGGAVASIFVVAGLTEEPMLALFSFGLLWLGGTVKHHEASRMLYEQSRHYENGILDENPPVLGQAPPRGLERFTLRYSSAF